MQTTTKIKLFLYRYSPRFVFVAIKKVSDTVLPVLLHYRRKLQISHFTKKHVKTVQYDKGSFDIIIDPSNGFVDQEIFLKKVYEPEIVSEFIQNIKHDDVCIDIGANIGHHTIIMAQLANNGSVIAYEPIPKLQKQLLQSLEKNNINNVRLESYGLSDTEGSMELFLSEGNIGSSSLINTTNEGSITITLKTLDSYLFPKVDFIKLDVEGYEYTVLLGAEKTIERCHPTILFEFSPIYYRKIRGDLPHDILHFFKKHKYTLFDIENNKKIITSIDAFVDEFKENLRSQTNIIAIPHHEAK